jgi:hypothetical protein
MFGLTLCLFGFFLAPQSMIGNDSRQPAAYYWENLANSAPEGTLWLNWDLTDPEFAQNPQTTVYYSTNGQGSWGSTLATLIGTPGYESTWESSFGLPSSGTVYYRLTTVERDTYYLTHSPKNISNLFPVPANLLTGTCNEAAGDVQDGGANLDLIDLKAGFSDQYLYFEITNLGGGWPTSGGLFGPWYIYGAGTVNPATADSAAYALIYADVPLFVSSGLYRIAIDSTFVQIGTVSTMISGNTLQIRCLWSDLLNDPYFGPWPNDFGCLVHSSATSTFRLVDSLALNDFTLPCFYFPEVFAAQIGANNDPSLSGPGVIGDSVLTFSVTYSDPDGHLPTVKTLFVDGEDHTLTSGDHTYVDGSLFTSAGIPLDPGWHTYSFLFSDGMAGVSTTVDSVYVEPPGLCGDADGNGSVTSADGYWILNYLGAGPEPVSCFAANVNGDSGLTTADGYHLLNYLGTGPELSCAACEF